MPPKLRQYLKMRIVQAAEGLSDAPEDNRPKLNYPQAAIWQWSSAAKVEGITGNVDLNV